MHTSLRSLMAVAVCAALAGLPAQAHAKGKQPKQSMWVNISGLPAGVAGKVTVKGPKGFKKKTLKATTLLKKLPTGTYRITAAPVSTTSGSANATVSKPKVRVTKSSRLKVSVTYQTPAPPSPAGQAIASAVQGPGVTIRNPAYIGSQEAQGAIAGVFSAPTRAKLSGAPDAWLLSTGRVADALLSPPLPGDEFFASTDFMLPGDETLASMLAPDEEGFKPSTRDAAFVTFQVVPEGTRLDIRYRFASEEYLEWVGSRFNDVMGIFVNGKNCATVSGIDGGPALAVAVNSVNNVTNSDLHVDNLLPPYKADTSYDGFTVPLTCSVATTPGTPVEVKIGVADVSDGIYDTAVALLNQGISSS